jgi:hypothetical protein
MFAAFGAWIHERLREEGERSGLWNDTEEFNANPIFD